MDPVTLTIAAITAVTTVISIRQYNKLKEKNKQVESLITALNQYATTYAFEECDKPMISSCQQFLDRFMNGKTYAQMLQGKTTEEQKHITEKLIAELAKRMQVNIGEIHIQPLAGSTLGAEVVDNSGKIIIHINELLLQADPDHMVFVILHELRHAVQDSAIRNDVWGYSDARKAQWLVGNQQYVNPENVSEFAAYEGQVLENDANAFAREVLKKRQLI